jgi:hypothetical protein
VTARPTPDVTKMTDAELIAEETRLAGLECPTEEDGERHSHVIDALKNRGYRYDREDGWVAHFVAAPKSPTLAERIRALFDQQLDYTEARAAERGFTPTQDAQALRELWAFLQEVTR